MDKVKQIETIFNLAVAMREAQKEYFKTRDYEALKKSKALEKRFDAEVQAYINPPKADNGLFAGVEA